MKANCLPKLIASVILAASVALPISPAQPVAAHTSWVQVFACPQGISIFAVEDDLSASAPQVSFNILPDGPGNSAKLVGSTTNDVPGGVGRQFIYWNGLALPAGARGQVIARGVRNESYATFTVADGCPPLGSVRGSAFEDLNGNGVRDPGEPGIGTASWKVTAGGDWFICGFVGGDSTFGPTVTPGTYSIIPVAQPGWRATTPPRNALVKQLGFAALNNDIGFVRANYPGDNCGQYAPAFAPAQPLPIPIAFDAATTLATDGAFNMLLTAASIAGVADVFSAPGPYTFLAPTDLAFEKLSPFTLNRLLNHPSQLAEILKCHIIPGVVDPASIGTRGRTYRTLGARAVTLRVRNGMLYANGVIVGDIEKTSNGNIFVLDRVLFVR